MVHDSWALSSAGEHYLHTVGVAGSNPVAPTMNSTGQMQAASGLFVYAPLFYSSCIPIRFRPSFPCKDNAVSVFRANLSPASSYCACLVANWGAERFWRRRCRADSFRSLLRLPCSFNYGRVASGWNHRLPGRRALRSRRRGMKRPPARRNSPLKPLPAGPSRKKIPDFPEKTLDGGGEGE